MDRDRIERFAFSPHSVPFAIERTEGAYLYTPEGEAILDAAGGAIVGNIGYGRAEVAEAVSQALQQNTYVVPPFATPERIRLVERLAEHWLPEGITRAMFVSGGSESVDAAVRLARQHHVLAGRTERWKVIATDLSYHGTTLATLAVGGHWSRRQGFEPLLVSHPKIPHPYSLEASLGRLSPDPRESIPDQLEQLIIDEGPDTVAAFIGEPVTGSAGGAIVPPDSYWPRTAEVCRKYGVLLISDEVMTGFGRLGCNFGIQCWGVTPDIMVGGKGLAGGYAPIGGVYASDEVVKPLADAHQDLMFYTFGAHPASCAAADKVLEIMQREDLVARVEPLGERLRQQLRERLSDHPHVAEVRGRGLLNAVEFVRNRDSLEKFPVETNFAARVVGEGLRRGVFYYRGGTGPVHDTLLLGPPFTVTEEEIDTMARVLRESVDAVTERLSPAEAAG
jgi:adenosylmethionine-8-amino-7-oxononanoate aminotransferase